MRMLLFFFVSVYFQATYVVGRSMPLDRNELAEIEFQRETGLKPLSEGNVVWTRVESNPQHVVHSDREESKSGNEGKQLESNSEFRMLHESFEGKGFVTEEVKDNGVTPETESLFSENNSKDSTGLDRNPNRVDSDAVLSQPSLMIDSSSKRKLPTILPELEMGNFSDVVIFNVLNFTQDSIVSRTLSENVSVIEYIDFDETSVMREGGEIAFFQEAPTSGFEFLIDSHTTNFLLTEVIGSQNVLIAEEDYDELSTLFGEEEYSASEIVNFNVNESEEIIPSILNAETAPVSTKSGIKEFESEDIEQTNELNSFVTEIKNTEIVVPKCPEPGWCLFWFFSQDICAENSHCFGSRICCKSGCSKTCIDV